MKLIKKQDYEDLILSEAWVVHFYDHKDLEFNTREDMEKYLNGDFSDQHGLMEYERIPSGVEHITYYDIDWEAQ